MSRLVLAVVAAALLVAAPVRGADAPPDRIAGLVGGLREAPVAVQPELTWLLPAGPLRRLQARLREAEVPVHVAVLSALDEDESGGDQMRQLRTLHERLGEPGLYLVVDQDGRIEPGFADVARDPVLPFRLLRDGSAGAPGGLDPADVARRIRAISAAVDGSAAAEPQSFDTAYDPEPLPELNRRRAGDLPSLAAVAVVGGLLAGTALYWIGLGAARLTSGPRART